MNPTVEIILMSLAAFLSGSLPFSVWVVRVFAKKDLRQFGSRNPGATNAYHAGGAAVGLLALMLDVTKGVLPVTFADQVLGYTGWQLIPIAVLPVAGHAFSPILGFKGGKALAVLFGTWIGLTIWKVPVIALPVVVMAVRLVRPDVWGLLVTFAAVGLAILLWIQDPWLAGILALQIPIILWKYRSEFAERPHLRDAKLRRQ
jgi:acyl phosphate:glycerol-3-phosphate acyltransferase